MTTPLDIPMPAISPEFTTEDIHKIREWNYERRKHMTVEDRCADRNRAAERMMREIEEIRKRRLATDV